MEKYPNPENINESLPKELQIDNDSLICPKHGFYVKIIKIYPNKDKIMIEYSCPANHGTTSTLQEFLKKDVPPLAAEYACSQHNEPFIGYCEICKKMFAQNVLMMRSI